jgi:hypothetical protein
MQFRWCHVENPFEKALQSRSFSRGIFIALGSMCLERNAFLPEVNSGKRRDLIVCPAHPLRRAERTGNDV